MANFPLVHRRRAATPSTGGENAPTADDDATPNQNHNANISRNATLSKCPRDLWTLWQEYEHGLDGRKPAREFSDVERGRVASTYSKRNHIWQLIGRLINRRGVHHNIAIDSIYDVYGQIPVTKIIKAVQKDAKTGEHPRLR